MRKIILPFLTICCFFIVNSGLAQQRSTLKGTVYDAQTLAPLNEVSVVIGSRGSLSDTLGNFTISGNTGDKIIFNYVGYSQLAYTVTERDKEKNIVIYLSIDEARSKMNEITVVGLVNKSRLLNPTASTKITADEIKDVTAASVVDILQGKIPGVNIQMTSGQPGARGSIFQRGLSNLNVSGEGNNAFLQTAQPLIIIDGVPVDMNTDNEYGFAQAGAGVSPLALIPPEDIASIEILKDAAATSQYGSRGAYGVWIINTKRGRSAVPLINYDVKVFLNTVPKLREVYGGRMERAIKIDQILNHNLYSDAYGWATVNANYLLSDSLNPYLNNAVNWQSYFFRPTVNQSHNMNISGGDPNFNYKVNLGYYNEKGIIENTGLDRYSLGMASTYQSDNKRFRLESSINASRAISKKGSGVGLLQTGVATSGMASTLLPPPDIYTENNAALAAFELKDNNNVNQVMANLNIKFMITEYLRFTTSNSMNFKSVNFNTLYPSFLNTADPLTGISPYGLYVGSNTSSQYNTYANRDYDYYSRSVLEFTKSLAQKHNFSTYVFTDLNVRKAKTNYSLLFGSANNLITGPFGYNLNRSRYGTVGAPIDKRIFGYGGNLSYNYDQKYIAELNFRIDGTSTNGPLSGYSYNPSVALKWNFFKENWISQSTPWMDYGDVRLSWGRAIVPQGNIFNIYGTYIPGSTYMGRPSVNLNYYASPNAYFLPSTTTTSNLGVDIGFLKGRFSIVYDTYYKTVENISRDVQIQKETGYEIFPSNEISMVNYGHELAINIQPFSSDKPFRWTINLNGAYNKNVLTKLPNDLRQMIVNPNDPLNLPVLYRVGRSSLGNVLYNTKGVYSFLEDVPVDPASGFRQRINDQYLVAGDPIFADLDGNYIINNLDRVSVGDPQPKITGGLINNFSYKNFGLTISASYTLFRDVLNTPLAKRFQYFYFPDNSNIASLQALPPISAYDYWKNPGDKATYPYPGDYQQNRAIDAFRYNQTLFQEDGSYFKFNYVTLSYTLDKRIAEKIRVKNARFYVTGQNLLMITNYSGPNPENVSDLGRDNPDGYPNARKYSIGVNATF